jgi:DNA-directed RNA polymerase specialized sigma24 family protein
MRPPNEPIEPSRQETEGRTAEAPSGKVTEPDSEVDLLQKPLVQRLLCDHDRWIAVATGLKRSLGCQGVDPEDIVAQAYVRVLQMGPRKPIQIRKLNAWFRRVIVSTARDLRRYETRQRRDVSRTVSESDAKDWILSLEDEDAAHYAQRITVASAIWQAVNEMNTVDRELFLRHGILELDHAEPASISRLDKDEERRRLRRIRRRLRQRIMKLLPDLARFLS